MSAAHQIEGCSCQLCNPTFVDVPVPPIKQDEDNDTEWTVVTGKTTQVRFNGAVVGNKTRELVHN